MHHVYTFDKLYGASITVFSVLMSDVVLVSSSGLASDSSFYIHSSYLNPHDLNSDLLDLHS